MSTKPASIGLFVIGDEILSGKRQDRHFSRVLGMLKARGLELASAHFLGDDEHAIADALVWARNRSDVVLSCGGIGATPDDVTRQAAARAFGLPIERHADAEALIVRRYGDAAWPSRVLMADFPRGAGLIPNPVNNVAGFYVDNCNFVPGFPEMAWPMLEWVLDQRYRGLHGSAASAEYRLRVEGTSGEGDLLPLMEDTLRQFPGVRLSSLPFRGDEARPRHIEFGFKGDRQQAADAYGFFVERLSASFDARVVDLDAPR